MFMPLRGADPDKSAAMMEQARRACIQAAQEVSRICRLYQEMYGFRLMNNTLTHVTTTALYVFLEEDDLSQYDSEATNLCTCLRALSRRWLMAMANLRIVHHHAKQRKVPLPLQLDIIFGEFGHVAGRPSELKRLIDMYPGPPSVVAGYTSTSKMEILDMGKFLE